MKTIIAYLCTLALIIITGTQSENTLADRITSNILIIKGAHTGYASSRIKESSLYIENRTLKKNNSDVATTNIKSKKDEWVYITPKQNKIALKAFKELLDIMPRTRDCKKAYDSLKSRYENSKKEKTISIISVKSWIEHVQKNQCSQLSLYVVRIKSLN